MEQFTTGALATLTTDGFKQLSTQYAPSGSTLTLDQTNHMLIWKQQYNGYEISLFITAYLLLLLFAAVQVCMYIGDLKKLSRGRRGNLLRKR